MAENGLTPVAFFGHGSPTTIMDDPATMSAWSTLAGIIGRPKAIICVSAHWCTEGVKVTAMEAPRTIHDFGRGLPSQLFEVQYPAPGSAELAVRIQQTLHPIPVELDHTWGLDHAAWFNHQALGRDAALSIPPPDLGHYWPLFYVLGARHPDDKLTMNPKHVQYKSLSMLSFVLDSAA